MPVTQSFAASIPVIDMQDYYSVNPERRARFIQDLSIALQAVGFVAAINSNVSPQVLDRAYDAARVFYAQDLATKMQNHAPALGGQRGYVQSEQAQGNASKDCKEFYHFSREFAPEVSLEYGYPQNIWPADLEFKESMLALISELDIYGKTIEEALAECIDEPLDFFSNITKDGAYIMRSLHYPANPPADTVWAAQHTDIDLFTILPRATAEGLQVLDADGKWVDVVVPDGAIIINAGDMLQNITNGFFKSATHRVVSKGAGERFSIVAFLHAKPNDKMDPLPKFIDSMGERKYPNATARELLTERLIDLGLLGKHTPEALKWFSESGAVQRLQEVGRASSRVLETLKEEGFSFGSGGGVNKKLRMARL